MQPVTDAACEHRMGRVESRIVALESRVNLLVGGLGVVIVLANCALAVVVATLTRAV